VQNRALCFTWWKWQHMCGEVKNFTNSQLLWSLANSLLKILKSTELGRSYSAPNLARFLNHSVSVRSFTVHLKFFPVYHPTSAPTKEQWRGQGWTAVDISCLHQDHSWNQSRSADLSGSGEVGGYWLDYVAKFLSVVHVPLCDGSNATVLYEAIGLH